MGKVVWKNSWQNTMYVPPSLIWGPRPTQAGTRRAGNREAAGVCASSRPILLPSAENHEETRPGSSTRTSAACSSYLLYFIKVSTRNRKLVHTSN